MAAESLTIVPILHRFSSVGSALGGLFPSNFIPHPRSFGPRAVHQTNQSTWARRVLCLLLALAPQAIQT